MTRILEAQLSKIRCITRSCTKLESKGNSSIYRRGLVKVRYHIYIAKKYSSHIMQCYRTNVSRHKITTRMSRHTNRIHIGLEYIKTEYRRKNGRRKWAIKEKETGHSTSLVQVEKSSLNRKWLCEEKEVGMKSFPSNSMNNYLVLRPHPNRSDMSKRQTKFDPATEAKAPQSSPTWERLPRTLVRPFKIPRSGQSTHNPASPSSTTSPKSYSNRTNSYAETAKRLKYRCIPTRVPQWKKDKIGRIDIKHAIIDHMRVMAGMFYYYIESQGKSRPEC